MFPHMTDAQVATVCDAVGDAFDLEGGRHCLTSR